MNKEACSVGFLDAGKQLRNYPSYALTAAANFSANFAVQRDSFTMISHGNWEIKKYPLLQDFFIGSKVSSFSTRNRDEREQFAKLEARELMAIYSVTSVNHLQKTNKEKWKCTIVVKAEDRTSLKAICICNCGIWSRSLTGFCIVPPCTTICFVSFCIKAVMNANVIEHLLDSYDLSK